MEQVLITLGFLQERDDERVYPGTCRSGLGGKPARAMRVLTVLGNEDITIRWTDRRLGRQRIVFRRRHVNSPRTRTAHAWACSW